MDEGGLASVGPWPWIISLFFILFSQYIAVSETALASVSKVRIKALSERGNKRAQKVLFALDHFDRTISTILVCTNIAHLATATVVTVSVTRVWGLSAVTLSTIITTLVVFFFAEMLPKSLAKKYSEVLSLRCIGSLLILVKIFTPISYLLSVIGNAAGRFTKGEEETTITEDEIYDIIEDMTEEGSLDEDHGELISSALQFGNVTVESVLTPRVDIVAIDVSDPVEDIMIQIREQNHSRLPVYEDSIDNIIGILRIKSFIKAYLKDRENVNVSDLLDEPLFVTESTTIDDLLPILTKNRQYMAVVTDHYGGTVGIITIEDILETLVGDIWDEDDVVEEPIKKLGEGRYLVDAEETVGDVFEELGFEAASDEEEDELLNKRVGEWVYDHFAAVPKLRDSFIYEGIIVSTAKMEHNRIRKVIFNLPGEREEGGEER